MVWSPIQLAAQAYEGRSRAAFIGECQNLYLEKNPEGAQGPVALLPTPGLTSLTTVGDGPIRGIHRMGPLLYVVSKTKLYTVDQSYSVTEIGDVEGTRPVAMSNNGTHVLITTGKTAYAADETTIVSLPESELIGTAYQDGYGIAVKKLTEQFYISAVDDMTSWAALDFSSADTFSDELVGLISDHRELWLFGANTIEIWHNVGNALFPFQRAGSGFIERGCVSGQSIVKSDNRVFWLAPGEDGFQVLSASGYAAKPISTPAIDRVISETDSPTTAVGFVYAQSGHKFYVLCFSDVTVVYDITTGRWHTRKSEGLDRWRVNSHAYAWGKHIVGDYSNNNIYELDLTTYTDNGDTIIRRATSRVLKAQSGKLITCGEVRLFAEMGVGLTSGQGSDPKVMLDWTDDDGRTWTGQKEASLGKIGESGDSFRAVFTRLGKFRHRTLRFSISDPVKTVLLDASANISVSAT